MKTVIYKTPVLCAPFGRNCKPFSRICALFDRSCKPFSRICALFGGSCTLFSGSSTLFGRNCKPAVLFAGLLLLASCSRDGQPLAIDDDTDGNGDSPVNIVVSRNAFTGAGDNGDETETKFTPGCLIGVAVDGSSEYTNVQYKYEQEGSALKAIAVTDKIYCKANSNQKVKAYYPYRGDGLYTQAYVQADQSAEADYYASDALEATGYVREGSLDLQFSHRMAKVIFTFSEAVSGVTILNQSLNTSSTTGSSEIKAYKSDTEGKKWKAFIVPGQTELKITGKRNATPQKAFNATFIVNSAMLAGGQYNHTVIDFIDTSGYTQKDLSTESISISDNGTYYITQSGSGTTDKNITVTAGTPTIYIDGLNISSGTAFHITGGTPTIILIGANKFKSTENGKAGIRLQGENAHVVIKGYGALDTEGGGAAMCLGGGPGIGASGTSGGGGETGGNITIEGGIITAKPGAGNAASIGTCGDAGVVSKCGNISISNATINVTKMDKCAAIGTGAALKYWDAISNLSCGTITITNSTVNVGKDAIGKGYAYESTNTCGTVTITNSYLAGTLTTDSYNP